MTAFLAGVLALGVVPAIVMVPSTPAAASVAVTNIGNQQPSLPWESHAQMIADLDAVAASGMTWVRTDFYWPLMEPQRGQFSWAATDAFVQAAAARGLHVLAVPDYSPAWASSGPTDHYPPRNVNDYAAFVATVARRYAPMGVRAWEIWNEENRASFWLPKADPPTYTRLLQASYSAIKHVDAGATVLSGGLSPAGDNGKDMAPQTFLDAIYRNGARGSFDAVAYHPYSWPYPPMYAASWNTFYNTPQVHALMAHYGDGNKLIWGTETGWPTGVGKNAVSEANQAAYTVAAIKQWESWSFHGPFFLYTIHDLGTNVRAWDQNMGMLHHSGAPKPLFAALRALIRNGISAPQPGAATRAAPQPGSSTNGSTAAGAPPATAAGSRAPIATAGLHAGAAAAAAIAAANCGSAHRAVPDHRIARPRPRAGLRCAADLSTRRAAA